MRSTKEKRKSKGRRVGDKEEFANISMRLLEDGRESDE